MAAKNELLNMALRRTYQRFGLSAFASGLAFALGTVAISNSQAESTGPEDQIVADIGKERVFLSEVDAHLQNQIGAELAVFDAPALRVLRRGALEQLIDERLLLLAPPAIDAVQIDEAELRHAYEANLDRFRSPDELKLRIIALPSEGTAGVDKSAETERILGEVRGDPKSFSRLAREHSTAPNRDRGGSLGTVTLNQLPSDIRAVALNLQAGEVSDIFETSAGLCILRVEERRAGTVFAFDSVRREIEEQMKRDMIAAKRREHLASLRKRLRPIVYLR